MKMAPIPPLRSRFAALAPANLRDTLNRHSRIVNIIALLIILLVVADLAGWTAPLERFFTRHSVWTVGRIDRPLAHCPVRFVTAMVSDDHGGAWIASEDSGIYHYQSGWPAHWQHYDQGNSPGLISNHIYSLCLDARGRLWAGTLRHGVCVFNGARWKHYGLLDGPLGSHVTAITSNPYDKSVWMCTEAGVSIYETGQHTWRYIPQAVLGKSDDLTANGLPPNPDSVAFNEQGVAFVGTQCSGLAIAIPPYRRWAVIQGPRKMPITPTGQGLPSNLINEVVAGNHGRIYVATDAGLAWNRLHHNPYLFHYEQGATYAARVRGLWHPPANFKMPPQGFLRKLPLGDHINCVAQDAAGKLWLGTWLRGWWTSALYRGSPAGAPSGRWAGPVASWALGAFLYFGHCAVGGRADTRGPLWGGRFGSELGFAVAMEPDGCGSQRLGGKVAPVALARRAAGVGQGPDSAAVGGVVPEPAEK